MEIYKNKGASLGGQVMAKRQRKEALERYYSNPQHCKNCGKIIEVKETEKVSSVKKKQFCNNSCAASFNQKGKPSKNKGNLKVESFICQYCGKEFVKNRTLSGEISKSKYCEVCKKNKYDSTLLPKGTKIVRDIELLTKEELFIGRKNWQCARSAIRRHAYKKFSKSGQKFKCKVCGYDIHVEVCHVKDVSKFSGEFLIKEINDLSNLIPLCPNHHWEFDNGKLKI